MLGWTLYHATSLNRRCSVEMGLESIVVPRGHWLVRIADDAALWGPADRMCHTSWPEFMHHDSVARRFWHRLRVHARAGARIVRGSPRSMTIAGSVGEWQEWTGLTFPISGPYVVEGALSPVEIDLATDRGVYYDPNVWMVHDLSRYPIEGSSNSTWQVGLEASRAY
jgi:hypothetical protein